jgi:uncharacterized surface protein with fasciclin (FAS1) repeats
VVTISVSDDPGSLDLIDTAAAHGTLNTFGRALHSAGMRDALRGPGPFTLLAPTDVAFGNLPPGKLDSLFDPANRAELVALLKYHVVRGRRSAADIGRWIAASTVHGQSAPVQLRHGRVSIDGANVTGADIASSNGVIHAIDKVNVPRQDEN